MADNHTLLGHNYTTPDLIAKVTGQAKYAEDYRADGMLFAKLLLSPMPHARVKKLDTTKALAMPGVRAILLPDELPKPEESVTDIGIVVKASPFDERGLTFEPCYRGEPILAVAAVDEWTAAEAIERIEIEFEPLPFAVDPLETLRPGSPNARTTGNVWMAVPALSGPPPAAQTPPGPMTGKVMAIAELKWKESDFEAMRDGRLPMGETNDPRLQWSYGDVESGFAQAALVLDETFVTPNVPNQPLESRSAMAYWQNGKLVIFCSTQSTAQTVRAVASWVGVDPSDVTLISEYTGGAFGSKVAGSLTMAIPALLAKKANAPVQMRITREEEHYLGRARVGLHGRMKVGFAKDGRITAVDMFVLGDNGPYKQEFDVLTSGNIMSLLYQPPAMRFRGMSVVTNTLPRGSQSQPGGMQAVALMEPILAKAARKLGIDELAIHVINAPEGKAPVGPPNARGQRQHATSAFLKEALQRGAEKFGWAERRARSGIRSGSKVRGVGVAMSAFSGGTVGFDGLLMIKPDGRVNFHSGIGNLGTHSVIDVHRVGAEILDVPWERCDVIWGNSAKFLPWTCISGGSQTTHAMTRAAHAAAMDAKRKLQEIAASALGGRPEDYALKAGNVVGRGRSLSFADAARKAIALGGAYDGHEVPADVNPFTKASVKGLQGQGLIGVAKDKYPRDGSTYSYVAGFAEVEIDVETGKYAVLDFLAVADVGTVINPRSLGGQILGRSMLGISHATTQKSVYDQHYGVDLATRFYQNRPPSILDAPHKMQWDALNIPDPESPVGARGIGEPPVGAGCTAVLNAISAALGDDIFRRTPVTLDVILTSLEAGRPVTETLTGHI